MNIEYNFKHINLPLEIKKNPSIDKIKDWGNKQKKIAKIMEIFSIVGILLSFICLIIANFDSLVCIFLFVFFFINFLFFRNRKNLFKFSEEEIASYLNNN